MPVIPWKSGASAPRKGHITRAGFSPGGRRFQGSDKVNEDADSPGPVKFS